jgi:hypothetical protein
VSIHPPWCGEMYGLMDDRYFCNPNSKSFIEALPGTYGTEEEKKYDGINSGQYLVQRLAATY